MLPKEVRVCVYANLRVCLHVPTGKCRRVWKLNKEIILLNLMAYLHWTGLGPRKVLGMELEAMATNM